MITEAHRHDPVTSDRKEEGPFKVLFDACEVVKEKVGSEALSTILWHLPISLLNQVE